MISNKLNLIIGIILILGIVTAIVSADIISSLTATKELNRSTREALISVSPRGTTEIRPAITIDCFQDYCKWSAYQEGLINTQDNIILRGSMTNDELFNKTSYLVQKKLEEYADTISVKNPTDTLKGTVIFVEKK